MESFIKYLANKSSPADLIGNTYNIIRTPKCHLLRFDGVSIPNPGESGCSAVIYDYSGTIVATKSQYIKYANNNQAEYGGLILGLEMATALGIKNLMIEGDSEYVIYQITGKYRAKDVYLDNIVKTLLESFDYIGIRHISAADNFDADKLSRECL